MAEHLDARVSVLESRVEKVEHENERTRERLHSLESGWATLKLLVEGFAEIRADVKTLLQKAAGDDAVHKANRRTFMATCAFLSAVAAFLYVVVAH